ncbi:MAG: SRPBCC domain-containing protein [Polyangiaceae bacterium]
MYSSSASILIRAPRQDVWEAVTKPDLVQKYFFGTLLTTDWSVGSSITFRGEWDGKAYEDLGTVCAFDPPRSLSFNYWSSFSGIEDKPELRQLIRYDIVDDDGGVRVTIHQSNVDTQERADHSAKNWQAVLEGLKSLAEHTL